MNDTVSMPEVNVETAKQLGLLPEEYEKIKSILGRNPNFTEISVYAVMWSEHCSYKNSIIWLKKLPKDGPHMLAKAGEENAGLVDIGDGLACAFKIESHNHPSAIEPYQGAATGVGGINRDIFTMGARPIAQLNSLRFGDLKHDRTKWLIKGVVKGIGDYGNAFGIPTVGGELYFDDCYATNPLVNAMSAGIVKVGETVSATSYGEGNPVYIVGSSTGKDGIHGAAFASRDITEDSADDLPAVQVGDPFQEKLLLEATLEVIKTGAVVGMQDMGAAGITCSTSEMSAKGEHGMDIYLDKVPLRQEGMKPFEILLSESQERMLIVVKKGREKEVKKVFEKWDLNCEEIGVVTKGGTLRYFMNGELVAEVPAESLVLGGGAPVYERKFREPEYYQMARKFQPSHIKEPATYKDVAEFLLSHPNICSRNWVSGQYDSMVGTVNMTSNKPSDASVVDIRGTDKAIALTVDCNGRYIHADPETGTAIAVAEAARNITCAGGRPSAITNCLNFGNPYNPEVYWQFVGAIKGMSKACERFRTPVTGGNVSFYNQSTKGDKTVPVFPTPTIGMLGILESKSLHTSLSFREDGDIIYLLGVRKEDFNSSEYLYSWHQVKLSPAPYFNLEEEVAVQELTAKAIRQGLVHSAHDVSDGGLFICLAESSMTSGKGFRIKTDPAVRKDAFLFGEAQGRIVVTISQDQKESAEELFAGSGVPFLQIGRVLASPEMMIDGEVFLTLDRARYLYEHTLTRLIDGENREGL